MFSILYVDDEPSLLEIGKIFLEKSARFSVDTTPSAPAALERVRTKQYDAIISDYLMPEMDGIELLKQVRAPGNPVPFIIFTGKGREEIVIQALNEGADYYVQKGGDPRSQFAELSHKILQAVQHKKAEAALAQSEERYRAVVEDQTELICRFSPDGRLTFVNDAYCRYFGLDRQQAMGRLHSVQLLPEDTQTIQHHLASLTPENPVAFIEHRVLMADGTTRWHRWSDRAIFGHDGKVIEYQSVGQDITDRKSMEDALSRSEEKYRVLVDHIQDGVFLSQDELLLFCNTPLARMIGYSTEELTGISIAGLIAPEDREMVIGRQRSRLAGNRIEETYEFRLLHRDGHTRVPVIMSVGCGTYLGRPSVIGTLHDVSREREAESALRESEKRLNLAQHIAKMGDVTWDLKTGVVNWSDGIYDLMQYDKTEKIDISRVNAEIHHPEDLERVTRWLDECISSGEDVITPNEYRIVRRDGTVLFVRTSGIIERSGGAPCKVFVTLQDISERVQDRKQLCDSLEKLKKSNADLELFTQIAAHDLQEPIRTIVAFSQILRKECRQGSGTVSEKYLQNIEHAGRRMNDLVNDLRMYSGIRPDKTALRRMDLEKILKAALDNLSLEIGETHASITHDPLPEVCVQKSQFIQVFQNLVDNAIKFRREGVPPEVHVSVSPLDTMWRFAVRDNGIGIRQQYFEKIFVLFERLHTRETFSGTGLGLALCKRVIEGHGGTIWVESETGQGSTFYFTVPRT
jgi:PAS domain S-box-containing protein